MGLFELFKKRRPAPPAGTAPPARPLLRPGGMPPHPQPKADNHFLIVILDSCRWDTFCEARPQTILKLGPVEMRYS